MKYRGIATRCLVAAAALGALTAGAAAQDEKVFKLGVVAFLSGPAAESFGKPAWDGVKTVIDALNAGSVIKPYDKVGFGGLKIEVDRSMRRAAPPSRSRSYVTPSSATTSMRYSATSARATVSR